MFLYHYLNKSATQLFEWGKISVKEIVKFTVTVFKCWSFVNLLENVTLISVGLEARFPKVPLTFWTRKAIWKTTIHLSWKSQLLSCCKYHRKQNNCKVSWLETFPFWRYKVFHVTRNVTEKFRDSGEKDPWHTRDCNLWTGFCLQNEIV